MNTVEQQKSHVGSVSLTPIDAKQIFENVRTEVTKANERRTDVSPSIDGLKDTRTFWEKVFWVKTEAEESKRVNDNFQEVKKYFGNDQVIPKEIFTKAESGAYLNEDEVASLKKLAYRGEQKLKFNQQLAERSGLNIQGNLADVFGDREPSERELLKYCDTLKKLLEKKACLPDIVTSDPDPRKFTFSFGNQEKPITIDVKNKSDLSELQENFQKCFTISSGFNLPDIQADTLNAADLFGSKEALEKNKIVYDLGKLSVDPRGFISKAWDNFFGLFFETTNVLNIKADNKAQIGSIKSNFNSIVGKNNPVQSFETTVLNKQSIEVKTKLENGERLTPDEVSKLQDDTLLAMRKQRYLDDLRNTLPIKFEFDARLIDEEQPAKAVFERYLHKLKEELIKGGYPGLVTSDVDVRKFLFFVDGKYKEITVDSLKDLPKLKKLLDQSLHDAKSEQMKLGTYQTKAEVKIDLGKAKLELEQVKADVERKDEDIKVLMEKIQKNEKELAELRKMGLVGSSTIIANQFVQEAQELKTEKNQDELRKEQAQRIQELAKLVSEKKIPYEPSFEIDESSLETILAGQARKIKTLEDLLAKEEKKISTEQTENSPTQIKGPEKKEEEKKSKQTWNEWFTRNDDDIPF